MMPIVIVMQIANHDGTPAIHDDSRDAEEEPNGSAGSQHYREVRSCLSERGSDFGWGRSAIANANTAFKKKLAAVIATMASDDEDEQGTAQIVKRLAAKRVGFEVVHCDPDPHRGQELHEREPPVEDQQLHAVEEHDECADRERERRKDPPRLAECPDRVFHHPLVPVADRSDQCREALRRP